MTRALRPKEVAEILSCDTGTVYRLIENNKLKAFKLGGRRLRIEPAEVERFKCAWSNTVENSPSITPMERAIPYVPPTRQ